MVAEDAGMMEPHVDQREQEQEQDNSTDAKNRILEDRYKAFEERMKKRPEGEAPARPEMRGRPYQNKVREIFTAAIERGHKCHACGHVNRFNTENRPIVIPVGIPILNESVMIPMIICNHCGCPYMIGELRAVVKEGLKLTMAQEEHHKRTAESG